MKWKRLVLALAFGVPALLKLTSGHEPLHHHGGDTAEFLVAVQRSPWVFGATILLEISIAAALFTSRWRLAAWASFATASTFLIYLGVLAGAGVDIAGCGCYGDETVPPPLHVLHLAVIGFVALSLMGEAHSEGMPSESASDPRTQLTA